MFHICLASMAPEWMAMKRTAEIERIASLCEQVVQASLAMLEYRADQISRQMRQVACIKRWAASDTWNLRLIGGWLLSL